MNHNHSRPLGGRRGAARAVMAVAALVASVIGFTTPASASIGGSFSIQFAAAEPTSYDHSTGGGAWDAGTNNLDVVQSLEGGSFRCGDTVSFLTHVMVASTAEATGYGKMTLELHYAFTMDTTGQSGAGFSQFDTVKVNYAPVTDLLEPSSTTDGMIADDGGSTASLTASTITGGTLFNNGTLHGTVTLDDLSAGEHLVVRTDVTIACAVGMKPTGNLQAQMDSANVIFTNGTTAANDTVNIGAQTVDLKKVGDLLAPAVTINKLTNGADGLQIAAGSAVNWTYLVTNTGNTALTGVSVVDDQGVTVTCPKSTLAAGESMTCTASGTAIAGNYMNVGTVTGTYNAATVSASDTSTYFGTAPAIDIQKTPDTQTVSYGGTASFSITVTNTGNVALESVTIADPLATDCVHTVGTLAIAGSSTYTCSATGLTASFTNTATTTGYYGALAVTDTDTAAITVLPLPVVDANKSVNPTSLPETGGNATYTYTVTNTHPTAFTVISITDDRLGNLAGMGTCETGTVLAQGQTYSCTVTLALAAESGTVITNTFTVVGRDVIGNTDTATATAHLTFTDVMPAINVTKSVAPTTVPETGGYVDYSFRVTNSGPETITVTALTDTPLALSETCTAIVGQVLAPGAHLDCSMNHVWLMGESGTTYVNTVTATGRDNELNSVSDTDTATVTFTNVMPQITVTKSVAPLTVPETGGYVDYSFTVTNSGPETITVTALTDTPLTLSDTCTSTIVNQVLAPGAHLDCAMTHVWLAGESGTAFVNTVTATGKDNENNSVSDTDTATVTFTNVMPTITLIKTANPTMVDFTGGYVDYTIRVTNTSLETVTILTLTDTPVALSPACTALIGMTLAPGAYLECVIAHVWTTGTAGTSLTDTATTTAEDNEHNVVSAMDTATVAFWWHGRTPGYWKNHLTVWVKYFPSDTVRSIFDVPSYLLTGGKLDLNGNGTEDTLYEALNYKGGSTLKGKAQILFRAAVASLLNVTYFGSMFPGADTEAALILYVETALNTGDAATIIQAASALDAWNNGDHSPL